MIKLLLNGLLSLLKTIISIVMSPLDALVANLFPNLGATLVAIINFLNGLINGIGFFGSLFPPIFRGVLLVALTTIAYYYSIWWAYSSLKKVWELIQKIKMW